MYHRHILSLSYNTLHLEELILFSYIVTQLFALLTGRASWRDSILVKSLSRLNKYLMSPTIQSPSPQSTSLGKPQSTVEFYDLDDPRISVRVPDSRPTPSFTGVVHVANVYQYPYDELPTFQARVPRQPGPKNQE
jgi:hypothetical protein